MYRFLKTAVAAILIIFVAITPSALSTNPIVSDYMASMFDGISYKDRSVQLDGSIMTIHLAEDVDNGSVNFIMRNVLYAKAHGVTEFRLIIDSPGGLVNEGMRLQEVFAKMEATTVCVVDGRADSMAFFILQMCDLRIMTARSTLLSHHAKVVIGHMVGDWRDYKRLSDALFKTDNDLVDLMYRMNIDRESIFKKIDDGDWIMGPGEALQLQAADGVIGSLEDLNAFMNAWFRGQNNPAQAPHP